MSTYQGRELECLGGLPREDTQGHPRMKRQCQLLLWHTAQGSRRMELDSCQLPLEHTQTYPRMELQLDCRLSLEDTHSYPRMELEHSSRLRPLQQ